MLHFVGGRLKPISLGSAGREGCFLDLGSSCNKFLVVSVSEIRRRCFEGVLHAWVNRSVGEHGGERSRGAEQEMPAPPPSHEEGTEQPLPSAQTVLLPS